MWIQISVLKISSYDDERYGFVSTFVSELCELAGAGVAAEAFWG